MKQAILLGGLLSVTLVGAYVTWTTPEGEAPVGDVPVLQISAEQLSAIVLHEGDKTVRLTRSTDAQGAWFVVETTEVKKVDPPKQDDVAALDPAADAPAAPDAATGSDAATPEAPAPAAVTEEVKTTFAGSADAEKIWKAFTPFHALRALDEPKPEDVVTYGLDKPAVTIDLDVGGKVTKVEVGGEAFGTRDRYARVDGKVYLLDDEAIRPLQHASTRLVERRVHPLEEAAITRIGVSKGDSTRTFVQKNGDDRARAYWADARKPEERDVEGTTWLGKLLRMRARSYDLEGVDVAALKPVFTFDVEGKDGAAWTIEILEGEAKGAPAFFARSSFTRSTVELTRSLTEEAVADLGNLFDGVSVPAPAEPAKKAEAPAPARPAMQPLPPEGL